MPDPQPGIHLAVSRTRLGQLNDQEYNAKLTNAVRSIIAKQEKPNLKVFVLSEQSLLPLIVAKILKCVQYKRHYLRRRIFLKKLI